MRYIITKSTLCTKDLSDQEILDMELKKLARIFLIDFSQHGNASINSFIYCRKGDRRDNNIDEPLYEAYQWLYNRGYIMKSLLNDNHFVTRAGQKLLDSSKP